MDYTTIVIAIIASIPGLLAFIAQMRRDRNEAKNQLNRSEIDATNVAQKAVQVLLEPLNKRVNDLDQLVNTCKGRLEEMEYQVKSKNIRIAELEATITQKDAKIAEMQCEINELRSRIVVLENGSKGEKE